MAGPGSGGDRGARRRRVRARVLLAAAALLVLIGGAVGWLALTRPPATGPAAPVTASAGPTVRPSPTAAPSLADLGPGPMNILLLGSDIRGSARDALARQAAMTLRAKLLLCLDSEDAQRSLQALLIDVAPEAITAALRSAE